MRRLYLSAVMPVLDYGSEIWFKGELEVDQLEALQKKALRSMLGASKTTPVAAMQCEAAIPPIRVHLLNKTRKYAIRLLTLPPHHTLRSLVPETFPPYPSGRDTFDDDQLWFRHPSSTLRLAWTLHTLAPWLGPETFFEHSSYRPPPWSTPPLIDFSLPSEDKSVAGTTHLSLIQQICTSNTH